MECGIIYLRKGGKVLEDKEKKTKKEETGGEGTALGLSLGLLFGLLFDNLAIGMILGLALGAGVDEVKKRKEK